MVEKFLSPLKSAFKNIYVYTPIYFCCENRIAAFAQRKRFFEMTQTCLSVFLELLHLYSLRWWAFQLGGSALGEVPCLGSI